MFSARILRVAQSSRSTARIAAFFLLTVVAATAARAQFVSDIYTFSKTGDPQNPQFIGVIAQGRDGNLYSSAPSRVPNVNQGTAFVITPSGSLTVFYNSTNHISSGLTLASDGRFYGTTSDGGLGSGTVFKLSAKGVLTALYAFTGGNDGAQPMNPPIEGIDGNFYGTTNAGGIKGFGTVYQLTPSGNLTTIHQFVGTDGSEPFGPLVQGVDGNLYGTTLNSTLSQSQGVVYKVSPSGAFKVLSQFGNGANSYAGLVQGYNGDFYGTTFNGGANGFGQVFKITPKGDFTGLYDFTGGLTDGANPCAGLALGNDAYFYGVAANGGGDGLGSVYRISANGGFKKIADFDGTHGANPLVPLIENTNGILYGDASVGGQTTNYGTFFKLKTPGLRPFVSLLPSSGKIGATIEILGQGFTGTTVVSFNGTEAKFTVVSDTYMTAVVPKGTATGFVTVTTPNGPLKSNKWFRVTK